MRAERVQAPRDRDAPTAAELLAEKQLNFLRKKEQTVTLKEITALGKLDPDGANAEKLLRALKLAIANQIKAGWLKSPPRDPFVADVVVAGGQAEA